MNKEMFSYIISQMTEITNFSKVPNKYDKKTHNVTKILNYDIILDEHVFYLAPQILGTCTWHSTFMVNIFFNYYINNSIKNKNFKIINLNHYYIGKRQYMLDILDSYKDILYMNNLNLQIIKHINKKNFKLNIKNFCKNIKYQYIERNYQGIDVYNPEDITILFNTNVTVEIPILIKMMQEYFTNIETSKQKIYQDKKFKEVYNKNFIEQLRYQLSETYALIKHSILLIHINEIFDNFICKDNVFMTKFNKFYENKINIVNFKNFITKNYPIIDVTENNIKIVYKFLKISYFLIQPISGEKTLGNNILIGYDLSNSEDFGICSSAQKMYNSEIKKINNIINRIIFNL